MGASRMNDSDDDTQLPGTWREMASRAHLGASATLGGGTFVFSIATFIVTTTLPTVVREIGGLRWFAWSTTVYVVASLIAGAVTARLLAGTGPRVAYRIAMALFAAGALLCGTAHDMGWMLAGRAVQGLGGGMLSALSFSMVRALFPRRLWSRAMTVISIVWGLATMAGPAVGGLFAQAGAWRGAFFSLAGVIPLLWIVVERSLPRRPPAAAPPRRLALGNLLLLAASAMAVALGGSATYWQGSLLGLIVAAGGIAWFRAREAGGGRLLPHGALDPTRGLGGTYAAQSFLLIAVVTEIYIPYFLQTLHGLTPLHAGYMSALMAAGWSLGSLASSGTDGRRRELAMILGPVAQFLALIGLALLLPRNGGDRVLLGIGAALLALGAGIGLCWPQLGARVFQTAPEGEKELAAACITVVITLANAFGSALAGMVTNLAGITVPGGAAAAAGALYGGFAIAPVLALFAILRLHAEEKVE